MSLSRVRSFCAVLFVALGNTQCEPPEEMAPPVAPGNTADLPQVNPSSSAQATPTDDENIYASGEVAIGTEAEGYDDDDPAALT
ncbi:MAG: hypothetical protein M3O46_03585, partial [Myxococcota bacterium]|nr:hypothetical protein [Myxococcota bacterium]